MGSTGLALRLKADFTNTNDNAGGQESTLELGHAGNNAYGFEFSNQSLLRATITGARTPKSRSRLLWIPVMST